MDLHELIALRIAQDRIQVAVRFAEQERILRTARARRSTRVRLGGALVRLGHWMMGHASPAVS
jgi:hypothetical protein